jgi:NADH-quinone oxidoreductase subunit J
MIQLAFYILSVLAIFFALMVVVSKNPVYSLLFLILTFFAVCGHLILLNAQFLAIVNLIVYAGAIMVLFLFVLMFLNLNQETEPHKPILLKVAAAIGGGLLLVTLIASMKRVETVELVTDSNNQIGLVKTLGKVLFTDFVLPFEISSILFLAAMVGAVLLGKKDIKS